MKTYPKFALVCDARNWAFDNIAKKIEAHFASEYQIKIFYTRDYDDPVEAFANVYMDFNPQRMHAFTREHFFTLFKDPTCAGELLNKHSINAGQFGGRLAESANSVSVHDHLYFSAAQLEQRQGLFQLIDAYSVCSPLLMDLYSSALDTPPACVTPDGVDLDLFLPKNTNRFLELHRPLVVGWVGNSSWGKKVEEDNKGFHTIVVPTIEKMQRKGLKVEGHFADRVVRWRDHSEMVEYYSEIDLLICASRHEGTPDPILEALACGVPVVTTNVGVVSSLQLDQSAGFVLRERSIVELERVLTEISKDRTKLKAFSDNARQHAVASCWSRQMACWEELDQICYKRHAKYSRAKQMLYRQYFELARRAPQKKSL